MLCTETNGADVASNDELMKSTCACCRAAAGVDGERVHVCVRVHH